MAEERTSALSVFVNIVAKVEHIVHGITTDRSAIRRKVSLGYHLLTSIWGGTEIGAGVDGKLDSGLDLVIWPWGGLGSSNHTVGTSIIASELVIIGRERFQSFGLDFDSEIDIVRCIDCSAVDRIRPTLLAGNYI